MKILQFGVIGVGHFGKHYVRLLADCPDVHLKNTANNSMEAKKLLQDSAIDCVIIATPVTSHFELINNAISLNKHVLVEKPMVTTVREAESVQAVLSEKQLTFMVGFQYVYNDCIRYIRELIHGKSLGKILYILGEHLYCGPIRADVGCFMDAAAHELSILQYLFNPGKVKKVIGQSLRFGALTHDDFTAATIHFENGPVTHLVASRFAPQKTRRFTIVAEQAMIVYDDTKVEGKITIYKRQFPSTGSLQDTTKSAVIGNDPPNIPTIIAEETLLNQVRHFIDCVHKKETPITNFDFGSWVVEQTEIILKSVQRI